MTLSTEEQRWEVARNKIAQLGSVPSSFSSLIRKLRADAQTPNRKISSGAQYELNRLLSSPALLSPMAHAALEFYPERLTNVTNLQKALVEIFSLEELCSLIGTLYLTRQLKKRCSDDEWKFISEILVPNCTLAGHLGSLVPPLGFERSLSAVSFSILGMALFQSSQAKDYSTYRRHLKKSNQYFDTAMEIKLFGCSTREIGSLLSQSVALSSSLASDFLQGPVADAGKRPSTGIHALNIWIDSLSKNGTAPQVAMDSKWYPAKEKVSEIEAMAQKIENGKSETAEWILKEGYQLATLKPLFMKLNENSQPEISVIEEDVEPFEEE